MSGNSSVGNAGVYEAQDQRTAKDSEENQATRYEEGKEGAHDQHDPKDERSIANRLAAAGPQNDDESGKKKTLEQKLGEEDPTAPARLHGNKPSRGAEIDKEIQDEEAAIIAKKDAAKKN